MQAAIAAARNGHCVTVLERDAEPGGQVRLAASVPNRAEFGDLVRNQSHECAAPRRDLRVRCRSRRRRGATPRSPDVVVDRCRFAAGSPVVGAGRCGVDRRRARRAGRSSASGGSRPGARRDRLSPGDVGRRAARRPRLPRSRWSHPAWWSARTSASPSTWRTGGSAPTAARASCSRPSWCRWAWRITRSRSSTIRPGGWNAATSTGSCWPCRRSRAMTCMSRCARRGCGSSGWATALHPAGRTPRLSTVSASVPPEVGSPERALTVVWAPELRVHPEVGSPERGVTVVWAPELRVRAQLRVRARGVGTWVRRRLPDRLG
jgi:hypothetical protein